ncbi:MAG: hypothetical protein FWD45_02310 [Coriobacteriia bacterium]|nr:hypothetical protein [Coriobacteriia bacterium]
MAKEKKVRSIRYIEVRELIIAVIMFAVTITATYLLMMILPGPGGS